VRLGLARSLEGARIMRLETRRAGLRYPFPENLAHRLEGRKIIGLGRRAKYLLIFLEQFPKNVKRFSDKRRGENKGLEQISDSEIAHSALEDDGVIISHLGMSGSWRVETHPQIKKHDHLIFQMMQKNQALYLTYHDPRRFGFLLLTSHSELDDHPMLRNLGVEPLGNEFSALILAAAFKGKKTPLKSALLDQRIIAGLGNIYVCEALWQAQLSPFVAAGALSGQERILDRLVASIRDVLIRALDAGGSTLRDYAHIDGTSGYFQHQFHVYGRENAPCPRCEAPILREVQAGRSTFYCNACQRLACQSLSEFNC